MTPSPVDPAAALIAAALPRPVFQDVAVTEPTSFTQRLAGSGFYGPFRVREGAAVIEDRAGHPMILALQVVAPASARVAAEIATVALNRLCGFETTPAQPCRLADAAE